MYILIFFEFLLFLLYLLYLLPSFLGTLVSASFADGVLFCSLVANLEVRAGGRSANVIPGMSGKLTLEGTNFKPRTTGAATSNLNNALKILRHRKHMSTR